MKFLEPFIPDISNSSEIKEIYNKKIFSNNGPFVQELEKKISNYLDVKHAILVNNGTSALTVAARVLLIPNSTILLPSFTFIATLSSVYGHSVVFSDSDLKTFTIDLEDVEKKIKDIKCIIAVSSFGNPCHIEELQNIAKKHDIKLIFDSAGAFGSEYKGEKLGSFGDLECFSLHATKIFSTIEGGLITTNNDVLAKKIRQMINFGFQDGEIVREGSNYRMNELLAIIGLKSLEKVDEYIANRQLYSKLYKEYLKGLPISFQEENNFQSIQLFPVLLENKIIRDNIKNYLEKNNIETRIYYNPLLNNVSIFSKEKTPKSEIINERILCLPIYSIMEKRI